MLRIKIDNIDFEAAEGLTIMDVARDAGIHIPTLCFSDRLPHYSSCMVCMVKDKTTGNFLPSCSALVQDGMDIESTSEDVVTIRKKSVELLLSEHRAECEAQCKVVCPEGYDIPMMNRLLSAKDLDGAVSLSISQTKFSVLKCFDCKGYCENACRRKKVDAPVSIRNMQMFVYRQIKKDLEQNSRDVACNVSTPRGLGQGDSPLPNQKAPKRFSSRTGTIEQNELYECLKECKNDLSRFRDITNIESAARESESCMHCDCRAAIDCKLRLLADELAVKDPKGKLVNAPIQKKININTGLIFENAKCIKCGLCVRLCEELKEEPALCFINRGFVSIISEPLTEDFENILRTRSKEVVEICPTGALSLRTPTASADL
jgi:predicted molibdopterin-dependent oxidoreductase YjgC